MTDESLDQLIDALNAGAIRERAFVRNLTPLVDWAKIWTKEPVGSAWDSAYDFYLVRANAGEAYVGIVLDMTTEDLHVWMKQAFRGVGHMCAALNTVVFPRFFQLGRERQRITFQDDAILTYAVTHLGFEKTGLLSAERDLRSYHAHPPIAGTDSALSRSDFESMERRIRLAGAQMRLIRDQLDMAYGTVDFEALDRIDSQLTALDDTLYAFIEQQQGALRA